MSRPTYRERAFARDRRKAAAARRLEREHTEDGAPPPARFTLPTPSAAALARTYCPFCHADGCSPNCQGASRQVPCHACGGYRQLDAGGTDWHACRP